MSDELTGGPGTTGFSKRIGRLNKLYHNLTPEQRANHPGFRRLLEVIKLEQELDDRTNENMLGYMQQEEPAAAPQEPAPPGTGQDKRIQETALGLDRPLNNTLDRFSKSGGAE